MFGSVYDFKMGANRRYGDPLSSLNAPAVDLPAEPRVHHVWVNLSNNKPPVEYAGLIIAWRQGINGWEAQVAHVTDVGFAALHINWVEASRLRPAVHPDEKNGRPMR